MRTFISVYCWPLITSQFLCLLGYRLDEPNRAVPVPSLELKKKSLSALDENCMGFLGDLHSGISYQPLYVADLYCILTSAVHIGSSWLLSHPIWVQGISSFQLAFDKWSCYRHTIEVTRAIRESCERAPAS